MFSRLVFSLITITVLCGCASESMDSCQTKQILFGPFPNFCNARGDTFNLEPTPAEKSQIIIYRPKKLFQNSAWPVIKLNQVNVGRLLNGGFLIVKVDPGSHHLLADSSYLNSWPIPDKAVTIEARAGTTYFLRLAPIHLSTEIAPGGSGIVNGFVQSDLVTREEAMSELENLKESPYIEVDDDAA